MLADLKQDLQRYRVLSGQSYLRILLVCQGAQANLVHRYGHWLRSPRRRHQILPRLLYVTTYALLDRLIKITTGISISPLAEIGPGFFIGHFGGIVVHGDVVIGRNCNISQGVTIGVGGRKGRRGSPRIGDRVYIAPGAKIFGPIEIGNDVAIGANAVVTRSLPDRAVAVGVPARVASLEGSFDFVEYYGMELDPARQQSLAESQVNAASGCAGGSATRGAEDGRPGIQDAAL